MNGAWIPVGFASPWMLLLLLVPITVAVLWRRPRREIAVRLAIVGVTIIAVAGPEWRVGEQTSDAVILIDRSASVTAATSPDDVAEWVDSIRSSHPEARWGVVAFGASADILALPEQRWTAAAVAGSSPIGEATNLEAGVEAAASLISGGGGEIVLLSDGAITKGLLEGITAARQAGIAVFTLPLPVRGGSDAAMVRLDLPETVDVGRRFLITARIDAEADVNAAVSFYRDGDLLDVMNVELSIGRNDVSVIDELTTPGMATYRAIVKADGDGINGNDAVSAFVRTTDRPTLLVVHSEPIEPLETLLAAAGRTYVHTDRVPGEAELAGYQQVLVCGIPLTDLGANEVARLEGYVRDGGGSLLVVQGSSELRGTPSMGLERILPVSYSVPEQAQEADLLVIFVLDRSGSMRNFAAGGMKIDLLKQATVAAVNLLPDEALIGVVAFDVDYDWIVPLQRVENREAFFSGLQGMQAGGGTDIYYALASALSQAAAADARVRHILLFTDGHTAEGIHDYDELVARVVSEGDVQVSVVAIGSNPNRAFLERFTEAGGGEFYEAADYSELPEISMRAIRRFSQSRFVRAEGSVTGTLAAGGLATIPAIDGHSVTYEKGSSEVLLWVDTGTRRDPLFVRWRSGRGSVGVLNTDLEGVWSANWLEWENGALLVDSFLAAIPNMSTAAGLAVDVVATTEELTVQVDARNERNDYVNFLDLEATLLPGLETVELVQIAPGLYEGVFPAANEGAYAVQVVDSARQLASSYSFVVPYSEEYALGTSGEDLLRRIAAETGGSHLNDPSEIALSVFEETARTIELYPGILFGAVILFLLDLVVRKLPALRHRRERKNEIA